MGLVSKNKRRNAPKLEARFFGSSSIKTLVRQQLGTNDGDESGGEGEGVQTTSLEN